MGILILSVVAALVIGAVLKLVTDRGVLDGFTDSEYIGRKRITRLEFVIGALICTVIVVPATAYVGNELALQNALTYHEFWNGYEVAAERADTECHRDGSCQFTYDCDPYTVTIHHAAITDSKGNVVSPAYDTYETHYHQCPYATVEWDFQIRTTLDTFHVERTFADNPVSFRNNPLPDNVRRGAPPQWQAAADRINRGDPGPVTVKKDYDNYILASQSTILHKFSSQLQQYKSVLPKPASTREVHDLYYADKAYFVGVDYLQNWSDAVMRFNAAFGSELQGDLHVVVVGQGVTTNPDDFVGALNAYWTSTELGRDAISKNALVVVVGIDGAKVQWARAFTGMPRGNEALLFDIQRELQGLDADPAKVVGGPVGQIKDGNFAAASPGAGKLEALVWGPNQFKRVKMGGYHYLGSEIETTTAQKWLIVVAAVFFSFIVWALLILIGSNQGEDRNDRTRRDRWGVDGHGDVHTLG